MGQGLGFGSLNVRTSQRPKNIRSYTAITHIMQNEKFDSVLDVGAGSLVHSEMFVKSGRTVTALDYGTSVYAENAKLNDKIEIIHTDILKWESTKKFDLLWMSHILEHNHNPGLLVNHVCQFASPRGLICITLPIMHHKLWPGHLTLWSPGLITYFLASLGYDMKHSKIIYGANEFSLISQVKKIDNMPNLDYDYGDIKRLKLFLPQWVKENGNPWK